jgi:protein-disulfide isomerase
MSKHSDYESYGKVFVVVFVAALIGAYAGVSLSGGFDFTPSTGDSGPSLGGNNFKGDANAPVTIVEFSDFECPFCGRFYSETLSQIEENYIDTGKVKMEYRHFPLSFHPEAGPAAEASECAREQGKFWDYHDILYENQGSLGEANYKKWAVELGLDTGKFDSCFDSGKFRDKVQQDFTDGQAAGVSGTPSFLINDKLVVGAQPFSVFESAIEEALAG